MRSSDFGATWQNVAFWPFAVSKIVVDPGYLTAASRSRRASPSSKAGTRG
jgi:hypothetical protein